MKLIERLRAAWRVFTYEYPIVLKGTAVKSGPPIEIEGPIQFRLAPGASRQEIRDEAAARFNRIVQEEGRPPLPFPKV